MCLEEEPLCDTHGSKYMLSINSPLKYQCDACYDDFWESQGFARQYTKELSK